MSLPPDFVKHYLRSRAVTQIPSLGTQQNISTFHRCSISTSSECFSAELEEADRYLLLENSLFLSQGLTPGLLYFLLELGRESTALRKSYGKSSNSYHVYVKCPTGTCSLICHFFCHSVGVFLTVNKS